MLLIQPLTFEIGVALVNLEKADSSSKTTTGAPSTDGRFRLVRMIACQHVKSVCRC